jgi:hypothetical protein
MDEKRLRKLSGLPEVPLTEAKNPEIKLGGHIIKLVALGTSRTPFGSNPAGVVQFDSEQYEVFKQGMINIWAFGKRTSLNRADQDKFDKWMDSHLGKKGY